MKPNSISPACRRLAFSVLAELDSSTCTGANAGRRSSKAASAHPWLWKVPPRSDVPIRMVMTVPGQLRLSAELLTEPS
jgi:hypothetical protein